MIMQNILQSATKIVLLMLVLGLIVLVFIGQQIPETYNNAVMMVLSFYFGQKTMSPNTNKK